MNQLKPIGDIINDSKDNNINNKYINVINDDVNSRYALNREKFKPNTPETQKALEIAEDLDDAQNYAFYLNVVNTIGTSDADRLWKVYQDDVKEKAKTRFPVRNKKGYFRYLYKRKLY